MDAKQFIQEKNDAAVEQLKAIDAEYMPRRDAALATIAMTEKWLEELGTSLPSESKPDPVAAPAVKIQMLQPIGEKFEAEKPAVEKPMEQAKPFRSGIAEVVMQRSQMEPNLIVQDQEKAPSETWRSARDLQPKARAS